MPGSEPIGSVGGSGVVAEAAETVPDPKLTHAHKWELIVEVFGGYKVHRCTCNCIQVKAPGLCEPQVFVPMAALAASEESREAIDAYCAKLRTALSSEAAGDHQYISTACQHNQHSSCRLNCKYCGAPCQCSCHKGGQGAVPSEAAGKVTDEEVEAAARSLRPAAFEKTSGFGHQQFAEEDREERERARAEARGALQAARRVSRPEAAGGEEKLGRVVDEAERWSVHHRTEQEAAKAEGDSRLAQEHAAVADAFDDMAQFARGGWPDHD